MAWENSTKDTYSVCACVWLVKCAEFRNRLEELRIDDIGGISEGAVLVQHDWESDEKYNLIAAACRVSGRRQRVWEDSEYQENGGDRKQ